MRRHGSALVVVLMALALLLALAVPFLAAGKLRSESSRERFSRTEARLAVDSATRLFTRVSATSHPAVDPTPLWDDPAEWDLGLKGPYPAVLGGSYEDGREAWGVETQSLQTLPSLSTAPPLLLQNLLRPCFVTDDIDFTQDSLPVSSTEGFPESGYLFVGAELVRYERIDERTFLDLEEVEEPPRDPERIRFREGTAAIDPRVVSLVLSHVEGGHRPIEFLADATAHDPFEFGVLPQDEIDRIARRTETRTGAFGAGMWCPPTVLVRDFDPVDSTAILTEDTLSLGSGSLVRLEADGVAFDTLALFNRGWVALWPPPTHPLYSYETTARALVREPVDINSTPFEVLVALAAGVKLQPHMAAMLSPESERDTVGDPWVTVGHARAFAEQVLSARPLRGPEDLWSRVLDPLMQAGRLHYIEAWALALNGLEAGHGALMQSTLPFAYRTGDAYRQRVVAASRSRIGRTMARIGEQHRAEVAPGGSLLQMWNTQDRFDDLARWGRGAHGTITVPSNLHGFEGAHDPPSGVGPRVGINPEWPPSEPSRSTAESAIMPAPAREADPSGQNDLGLTLHFDDVPDAEGLDVSEHGMRVMSVEDLGLDEGDGVSDVQPLHAQGWFKLESGSASAGLIDLLGESVDRNRMQALLDEGDLVVRAWDDAGEDPLDLDGYQECAEVRISPDDYDFLGRWFHIGALLRGVSPDGLLVDVDGAPRGEVKGRTWLTGEVSDWVPGDADSEIAVESTEGFPSQGLIRIGSEVIEYSGKTSTSFILERVATAEGYLGGRAARESTLAHVLAVATSHPSGSGVELCGYASPLESNIPAGGGRVTGAIGPFSVARGSEGPDDITASLLDPSGNNTITIPLGTGILATYVGPLELIPAVDGDPHYADAFQEDGGYAILIQRPRYWSQSGVPVVDQNGDRIGGVELVRYSARTGTTLEIQERNVQPNDLAEAGSDYHDGLGRSFLTDWDPNIQGSNGPLADLASAQVYILPVSVKGSGVTDLTYLPANEEQSQFAQISSPTDAASTEWIRYDRIINGCFVRDEWNAVYNAFTALNPDLWQVGDGEWPPPGSSSAGTWPTYSPIEQTTPHIRSIGEPEEIDATIEAVRLALGFRGVMGTFTHAHTVQERIVPVFRTLRTSPHGGYPGRLDRVAVMQPDDSALPPQWYTVQWGMAPGQFYDDRVQVGLTYVAFAEDPGLPAVGATSETLYGLDGDVRYSPRIVKFPSGERPRGLDRFAVGGDATGAASEMSGWVDEVELHTPPGLLDAGAPVSRLAGFILEADLYDMSEDPIRLSPQLPFVAGGIPIPTSSQVLPPSGLLDIDGERIAYQRIDEGVGELELAIDGRALLGTTARSHSAGTLVRLVDGRAASTLASAVGPTDATLELEDSSRFRPMESILIGRELVHPAWKQGNSLLFARRPRDQVADDDDDGEGDALLRGRFGTTASEHEVGEFVYSFPCRYLDRYEPRSDHPVIASYEFGLNEPDALWRGVFFDAEPFEDPSLRVRLLVRAEPADWDDDPSSTPALSLFEQGRSEDGGPLPLWLHTDAIQCRILFDWESGAFDSEQFLATGWTEAPRVRALGIDYFAESRVTERREVIE